MRIPPTLLRTCAFLPVALIAGCGASSKSTPLSPETPGSTKAPVLSWPQPASVTSQTPLGTTQLNATANVPGTFAYNPAAGSTLKAGDQTLSVKFTPNDATQYSAATASTTIHVVDPEDAPTVTAVQISGSATSVQAGATIQLAATAVYSDKSTKDVTASAQWTSTNTAAATVKAGTVSGVGAGSTQISASFNNVASAAAPITVTPPPAAAPPPPAQVTLSTIQISGSSSIGAGANVQLKAMGTYSDKTTKDLTSTATWTSSQTSVAAVQGGLVTGVNAGTADIVASSDGVTATAKITVTKGVAVQIDPSMSQTDIQNAINGSQNGDTIAFASGTYKLVNPGLKLPAGRTYLGSTSGASILSGAGGYSLASFSGDGLTIQNITFDGGGLYLAGAVNNVHVEQDTFQNINAPYANWTAEIAIFIDTSAANSDFSNNTFKNIGANLQDKFQDEVFSAGMLGKGLSNVTIENNSFDTFTEGIHIFYDNLDGKNVHINHNTFVHGHRIAIEQQNGHAGGLEVAYNTLKEPLNGWALTYGLSIAASSDSGTGIIVHDNLIDADTPVGADCRGSGCYYPYGIEAWGTGTKVYNNTVEGLWGHGVSIGSATNLSVTDNTICGPNMQADNSFVDYEYGSEPGTVIQGNTTTAALTCGSGN